MIAQIRASLVLVLVGLGLELISVLWLTPATFTLFLALGVPLCAAGAVLFLHRVWSQLVARRAL